MASTASSSAVPKPKCRCCPYGFHIDLDFVNFAEEVSKGQSRRTPTLQRKHFTTTERTLTSPLDSIFSDSLENIVSDFEEVLDRQYQSDIEPPIRHTNGYTSDYTGYKGRPVRSSSPKSNGVQNGNGYHSNYSKNNSFALEFNGVPPKPLNRPSSLSGGARAVITKNNSAYTALGRTLSEIKARQSMETLVESPCPTPPRLSGTPIDLGLSPAVNYSRTETEYIPPKSPKPELSLPLSNGPSWRRAPPPQLPTVPPPSDRNGSSDTHEFASLRRGREVAVSDSESSTSHRVRYYSSSPKMPRKLVAAPPLPNDSNFTYSTQNGHTVLARNQATSMSPRQNGEQLHIQTGLLSPIPPKPPKRETKSVSSNTGPLPPAKPCIECPPLKKKLQYMEENPPLPPKPEVSSICIETDPLPIKETKEQGTGKRTDTLSIAIGTDHREMREAETQREAEEVGEKETQTIVVSTAHIEISAHPTMISIGMNTNEEKKTELTHFGVNTEGEFVPSEPSAPVPEIEFQDGSTNTVPTSFVDCATGESVKTVERETMTLRAYYRSFPCQTSEKETRDSACSPIAQLLSEYTEEIVKVEMQKVEASPSTTTVSIGCDPIDIPSTSNHVDVQTDEVEQLSNGLQMEPRVLSESDIADSLWLVPDKETSEMCCGPDIPFHSIVHGMNECVECLKREQTFTRNVGVGACSVGDKVCANCDSNMEIVDENEVPGFTPEKTPERTELTRASATKKLLEQKQSFVRGTPISRSCRLERTNKTDALEYIETQHNKVTPQKEHSPSPVTTPSVDVTEALTAKVVLKKEIPPPPSKLPEPIPAKIPRPKISKYAAPHEEAETPDEAEEAADRLTPLRSELRSLGRWSRNGQTTNYNQGNRGDTLKHSDSDEEEGEESDGSEGTYDCQENEPLQESSPFDISPPLREALDSLNAHLLQPETISAETADWALKYVQHEWLKTAARKNSLPGDVEVILVALKEMGPTILKTVVNMTDQNGNCALHYAVSHCNFSVVSTLLDSGECQLNLANKAGYTPVMLAALSNLEDDVEKAVVQRLFQMGDVNARASQHGQTALMLAVSHGKKETTKLLLQTGADVNIQDEEGSTSLMCAAEHGHRELVKILLNEPTIDASLTDCDSSTALTIAIENGHRDIGVLIYAHLNYAVDEA